MVDPKDLWRKPAAVFFATFPASFDSLSRAVPFPLGWSYRPVTDLIEPQTSRDLSDLNRALFPDRNFESNVEKRHVQGLEDAMRPGFLTGWIRIIYGNEATLSAEASECDPWRLALRVHAPWSGFSPNVALSEWQFGRPPDVEELLLNDVKLLEGVRVLGKVVGWIGTQSPSTDVE